MWFELVIAVSGVAVYQKKIGKKKQFLKKILHIKNHSLPLILGSHRNQELLALSSNEEILARKKNEEIIDRKFYASIVSTGLAAAGALIYTPLSVLCLPGIVYVSKDIVISGYHSLVDKRKVNVDVLSALCKIFLLISGHLFICCLTTVTFSVNRKILNKIKANSKSSLIDVFRQQPRVAWIIQDGVECEVPITSLAHDSIVVVGAGEVIPIDGEIILGVASVDQHILTGESQPAEKTCGDSVFAATLVLAGNIQIRVGKIGEQTTAAQIGRILNKTSDIKTEQQLQAEQLSDKTVLPTLMLSAITIPILGPVSALVVLQSHFKYRMTIVSSIGLLNYLNLASQKGLLVKNGCAFEQLKTIDTVVFDKTGTLTKEIPEVRDIHPCANYTEDTILQYAAAAEGKQTHPVAQAIIAEAESRHLELPILDQAEYTIGYGLSAKINHKVIQVGSVRFMEMAKISLPDTLQTVYDNCFAQGHTLILLAIDGQIAGGIELHPAVRPEAKLIIEGLYKRGITSTYIISGDHEAPTQSLAKNLGISNYFSEVLPEQKANLIKELQNNGKSVCFVGDGINDCIAMKQANVSVSLGNASTVAIDTSQVILLNNNLTQLCELFDLSQEFASNMKISSAAIIVPSAIAMSGALFSGLGLGAALILPQIGLIIGAVNSMKPLLKHGLFQYNLSESEKPEK